MPNQVRGMAERYFGGWRQDAEPVQAPSAAEPLPRPQGRSLELTRPARAGPALMQAFYRPGIASLDAPVLDVIGCAPNCVTTPLC